MMQEQEDGILTPLVLKRYETEINALLMSFVARRGERGFTEEEYGIVLQWAVETFAWHDILHAVLSGRNAIEVVDGELGFLGDQSFGLADDVDFDVDEAIADILGSEVE